MINDEYIHNNKTYVRKIELTVSDETVYQEITYIEDFKEDFKNSYDGSESHLKKKTKEVIFELAKAMMERLDEDDKKVKV